MEHYLGIQNLDVCTHLSKWNRVLHDPNLLFIKSSSEKKRLSPHIIINLGLVDPRMSIDRLQGVYTFPELVCKCVYVYICMYIHTHPFMVTNFHTSCWNHILNHCQSWTRAQHEFHNVTCCELRNRLYWGNKGKFTSQGQENGNPQVPILLLFHWETCWDLDSLPDMQHGFVFP